MAKERSNNALQIIFSFFLGLMVVAFIGVGVFTFYPPPEERFSDELQELYDQQNDILNFKDQTQLTTDERARLRVIEEQIRETQERQDARRETWGRNTSIILITFATIVMSISLIRADQLRVISNGLLLGGVFTMLYGTGWVIATGTSQARFWVMTVALVITLALGYAKFVRNRDGAPAVLPQESGTAGTVDAGAVADLVARINRLEARDEAIAAAFKRSDEERAPQ